MSAHTLRPGPLDCHAHVVPEALLARFAAGERPGFGVEWLPAGRPRIIVGGEPLTRPLMRGMYSLETRWRDMAEQGVAAQLLAPWVSLTGYDLPADDMAWLSRVQNETIAALVRDHPDRFAGLGSVPLGEPGRAVEVLREAVREHGLLGVQIAATAGANRDLDDPALEPFWAAAEALDAFVMIHPHLGIGGPRFARYYFWNLIANPLDTTIAGACLILGGVMERHPRLKVCLVHGGGFLPYNLGRLARGRAVRPEAQVAITGGVEDSFRRFLFDTVTHSPAALRFLLGEGPAEHVLLGSDYPFDMGDPDPVATVRAAGLTDAEQALVLRGNAERWLGLS